MFFLLPPLYKDLVFKDHLRRIIMQLLIQLPFQDRRNTFMHPLTEAVNKRPAIKTIVILTGVIVTERDIQQLDRFMRKRGETEQ